jgi:hypothetical protein
VWKWKDEHTVENTTPCTPSPVALELVLPSSPKRHSIRALTVMLRGRPDVEMTTALLRAHPEITDLCVACQTPTRRACRTPSLRSGSLATPSQRSAFLHNPIEEIHTTPAWAAFARTLSEHPGLERVASWMHLFPFNISRDWPERDVYAALEEATIAANAQRRDEGRDRAAWAVVEANLARRKAPSLANSFAALGVPSNSFATLGVPSNSFASLGVLPTSASSLPWHFFSIAERVRAYLGRNRAPQLVHEPYG